MSEKKFTGKFKSKLNHNKSEGANNPDTLVKNYNKGKVEEVNDFEDSSVNTNDTLVGKPTGGRRSVVQPVRDYDKDIIDDSIYVEEEVREVESGLGRSDSNYMDDYDFGEISRKQQEEEESRRREMARKEELDKISGNSSRRRSPYETDDFIERTYEGPVVDLNMSKEQYSEGERVRTLKPILSEDKKEIEVGTLDIKPLKIGAIKDSKGYISARINEMEDKYKVAVLPFSVTGTLPQVEELSEHRILYINNMKYSSGTKRIVNQTKLDCYIENIRRHIEKGEAFEDSLLERVTVNGKIFDTLKFNEMELRMINTLFLEVTAAFYVDQSGDVRINVGGYNV